MTLDDRPTKVALAVREALSDDLRRAPWQGDPNPMAGHCYVASEAVWHLLGGMESEWRSFRMRMDDAVHWWLEMPVDEGTRVLDPTMDQFDELPTYRHGTSGGFLTKEPSKRAQIVIDRVLAANPDIIDS